MLTKIWVGLAFLVSLLAASSVRADDIFVTRIGGGPGQTSSYSVGVITPELEVWGFNLNTFRDLEVGRVWPVYASKHSTVALGGYFVSLPDVDQYDFAPWLSASAWDGRWRSSLDVGGYAPLNGGVPALYVSEAFLGYQVTPRLKVGVATGFFQTEHFLQDVPVGPSVKYHVGKRTDVSARYLFGGNGQNSFRLQANWGF